jgi:tetratricopeptide (TPR) repeat protein
MHHALDVITTLDPHFIEAYDLGSIALAELAGQAELGNALLQKGISANPHAWRLHFVLGFNYFFHQRQYDLAANAMAQAARLPGVPSYVPQLAARLYVQAQDPQAAILFLDSMLGDSPTQELRRSLEYRKQEVLVERDILAIEQAITKYQQRYSHTPRSLNQLVEHGFLSALPSEPFGGMYQLDPTTGDVNSTTHRKRLKLFQPSKV